MPPKYAIYFVYADGNPQRDMWDLSREEAIENYDRLMSLYQRVPPFIGIIDEDDEERGWMTSDNLREEGA